MQIRIVINATEDPEPRQTLFHPANILHWISSTFVKFFWHIYVSYKCNEIRWE